MRSNGQWSSVTTKKHVTTSSPEKNKGSSHTKTIKSNHAPTGLNRRNDSNQDCTYLTPKDLLAELKISPELFDSHDVAAELWAQAVAAFPKKGVAVYVSKASGLPTLKFPRGSRVPELVARVLLLAGDTSGACRLVGMCNREACVAPLMLLLGEVAANRIVLAEADTNALRPALLGAGKYLFQPPSNAEFLNLLSLCPQGLKADLVLECALRSPLLMLPSTADALAALAPADWDKAMARAIDKASKSPHRAKRFADLAKLANKLYEEKGIQHLCGVMAVALNRKLLDAAAGSTFDELLNIESQLPEELKPEWTWRCASDEEKNKRFATLIGDLKETTTIDFDLASGWVEAPGDLPAGWQGAVLSFVEEAPRLGPSYASLIESLVASKWATLLDYAVKSESPLRWLRAMATVATTNDPSEPYADLHIARHKDMHIALLEANTPLSAADYGSIASCMPASIAVSAFSQACAGLFGAQTSANRPAWPGQTVQGLTRDEEKVLHKAAKARLSQNASLAEYPDQLFAYLQTAATLGPNIWKNALNDCGSIESIREPLRKAIQRAKADGNVGRLADLIALTAKFPEELDELLVALLTLARSRWECDIVEDQLSWHKYDFPGYGYSAHAYKWVVLTKAFAKKTDPLERLGYLQRKLAKGELGSIRSDAADELRF
jgi:hypothetical protein